MFVWCKSFKAIGRTVENRCEVGLPSGRYLMIGSWASRHPSPQDLYISSTHLLYDINELSNVDWKSALLT